jgi:hypothetical protein
MIIYEILMKEEPYKGNMEICKLNKMRFDVILEENIDRKDDNFCQE